MGVAMDINPVNALIHPIRTVENALKKPNFDRAFFIVLTPTILFAAFTLFSGMNFELLEIFGYAVMHYAAWVLAAAAIYFFAFIAKGKEIKGKFSAILSATSIIWMFAAIMILVSFMAINSSPKINAFAMEMRNENISADELEAMYHLLHAGDQKALENYASARNISAGIGHYMVSESEAATFYNAVMIAVIAIGILLIYSLFLYPFIVIKKVTGYGTAASFVLYLLSSAVILPLMMTFVFHL